jgi:hypothetical protein
MDELAVRAESEKIILSGTQLPAFEKFTLRVPLTE